MQHSGLSADQRSGGNRQFGSRWYVAATLPRKEVVASENLHRQEFRSFCPRFRKLRRHARREGIVLEPLFPGYIFVRFDADNQPWRSINGTHGVRGLVTGGRVRPQPMPEHAMEQLFARCDKGIVGRMVETLEPGRTVRIVSGPFADQLGEIEMLDSNGRVRVLLDLLGKQCSVRMDLAALSLI